MELFHEAEIFVVLALLVFLAVIAYFGVHRMIGGALDARAARIRQELEEARRLREEAQATFAQFERKQREVEDQAQEIVAHAREEAERMAEKAKDDLAASIERRLKAAEEQIALAEAKAVKEVRDQAADVAVAAAAQVMKERISDEKASELIDQAIAGVGQRLH